VNQKALLVRANDGVDRHESLRKRMIHVLLAHEQKPSKPNDLATSASEREAAR
jgi:hypothetical protein